ncbi:hypothetical protein NECAME_01693 [Necator americanus]|uniref:Transmembrane protein 144 n=1 Tax=Necator americanus TaxID=51031 RepID=W2TP89_NECAM|nr:hypothetical protein NECAME_01693 [Necator americanus]ETN83900.1 hypothetical protein NECAME_01693 [Necator americanus]
MSVEIGLSACVVAALFFGTVFVPITKYDAADGMFAQWVMSVAILVVGFLVFCLEGFPGFYPLAMLGGMFWAIGNASAVPIISRLGMALGVLIWSITACLTGWAGGRFGLFGMRPNPPASDILNYGGLVFVIIGGVLFSRINSDTNSIVSEKAAIDLKRAKNEEAQEKKQVTNEDTKTPVKEDSSENPVILQERKQRLIGFVTALIAGVFYGMMLVPVIYMVENPEQFPSYPQDFLPYMFSQNVGIFLTATAMFIGYALIKQVSMVLRYIPEVIYGKPTHHVGLNCTETIWSSLQCSFLYDRSLTTVFTRNLLMVNPSANSRTVVISHIR